MKQLFLLLLLLISSLQAKENIIITKPSDTFYEFTVEEYIDKNNTLTYEEFKNLSYFTSSNNHLSKGYSNSTFWYHFSVKNETTKPLTYYLQFSEVFLHQVDFYLDDGVNVTHTVEGLQTLSKSKQKTHKPTLEITLEPNETNMVTMKINSKYPLFSDFYLLNKKDLFDHSHKSDLFYTFFLAAIFALILYNSSFYIFLKEKSYLYYVLFGSFFLIWQLVQTGFQPFNEFVHPNNFYYVSLSIPLMLIFLILFTKSLLDIKESFPKSDKILTITIYLFSALFIIGFFNFQLAFTFIDMLAFILLPYLLFIGIKSCLNKNKTALFYVIAQFSFILTATTFALAAYGLYEFNNYTRNAIIVGGTIEMILFSFALAYRIKIFEIEKIDIIQQANDELEQKVKERTSELEESKKRLEKLINNDPLTNLHNRQCLFDVSKRLISLSKREHKPLSLLIFDLDHFKAINRRYGQGIGDSALISFSWCLKRLRDSDVTARFGGEEFVVILPNTTQENAKKIAETIRKECEKIELNVKEGTNIRFTVSCGVSTLCEQDNTIEDVINRADRCLSKAKQTGRNRVISE